MLRAQGVENIFVETYAVTPGRTAVDPALTTYRIYVDLAPGYRLQMVYGDKLHPLKIATTTEFFNDTLNGERYACRMNADRLNTWPLALDSWLTIGAASDGHMGVPRDLDADGSVLECPPYADATFPTARSAQHALKPLCIVDGLKRDTAVQDVVDFKFSTSYLGKIRGNLLETTDGAWAVLGGMPGMTEENMVLIAQISTTGMLSFMLNLQLGTPDHRVVKFVANDAGDGELLFGGLSYGSFLRKP
jgi:hypothetical protein